jgi:hypothetical protein
VAELDGHGKGNGEERNNLEESCICHTVLRARIMPHENASWKQAGHK